MNTKNVRLTTYKSEKGGKTYTYWILRWHDGHGRRQSRNIGRADGRNALSRRQAELERSQWEHELRANGPRPSRSETMTLGELLERFLDVRKSELAVGSIRLYKMTGVYLKEFFGENRRIDQITENDATDFKVALADGKLSTRSKPADYTVDQRMRQACTLFGFAVKEKRIAVNPFSGKAKRKYGKKSWHRVTDGEFGKLMDKARSDWRLLLGLARWAGLRRGEALNLHWQDIDWGRRRLTVIACDGWNPKDKDSRVVPIVPKLYPVLLEAKDAAANLRGKIIDTINPKNVDRDFKVLCRHADVEVWSKPMHTLRKTCLTCWAEEHPMHVLKEWAGHADERTTMQFYLKVSDLEYDKAAGLDKPEQKDSNGQPPSAAA